jgi:transcriptional repressor NrdR
MKCPYCDSGENKVLDKRPTEEAVATRRRRECLKCSKRFTTYERVEVLALSILKKDGSKQEYDREKLKAGLLKACEKRLTDEQVDEIVDDVEVKLRRKKHTEIKSQYLGELVMRKLKRVDPVCYMRFASVYRGFEDVNGFKQELKNLV